MTPISFTTYCTRTPRSQKAPSLQEEHRDSYAIDTIVHNELVYTSMLHYLEHYHGVHGGYAARKWVKKHSYPVHDS